jgi:hypothetical protein
LRGIAATPPGKAIAFIAKKHSGDVEGSVLDPKDLFSDFRHLIDEGDARQYRTSMPLMRPTGNCSFWRCEVTRFKKFPTISR